MLWKYKITLKLGVSEPQECHGVVCAAGMYNADRKVREYYKFFNIVSCHLTPITDVIQVEDIKEI